MKMKTAVAALAAAFVPSAALAQSSATIGGAYFLNYETAKANGATAGSTANIRSYDRVADGYGSNIRFTVIEDLGGGNRAFITVESIVIGNADTRSDALGKGGAISSGNTATIWGNRNSAVGLRSKTAGRFLIGLWDVHYDVFNFTEGWTRTYANYGTSIAALFGSFGAASNINPAIGARFSNVIRWDSPTWDGITLTAAYARPTDAPPVNQPGDVRDGRNNRVWNFSPDFESGPFKARYTYLRDQDAVTNTPISLAGVLLAGGATIPAAWKITSNRVGAQYKFANGLWASLVWDSSSLSNITNVPVAQLGIKRSVWALPLSYAIGNHTFSVTYAKASNWKGSVSGADVRAYASQGFNLGSATGARFASFLYAYSLSQRTALYASYQKVNNRPLARYDFFAFPAGLGPGSYGADPTVFTLGMRHYF
jgi:predicted porin